MDKNLKKNIYDNLHNGKSDYSPINGNYKNVDKYLDIIRKQKGLKSIFVVGVYKDGGEIHAIDYPDKNGEQLIGWVEIILQELINNDYPNELW